MTTKITPEGPDTICQLLRTAANMIDYNPWDERDSAVWRVADAGLLLRELIEHGGHKDVIGLDKPTGRGAMLPKRIERKP